MLQQLPQKKQLNWYAIISIGLLHILAFSDYFFFSWSAFFVFIFLSWLTGCIGITLCYHRLLTHRSFSTPKWFEYILAMIGTLALQGSPAQWVGDHRVHHRHSDGKGDTHSPNDGFAFAHVFWLFWENKQNLLKAKDLTRDPFYYYLNRYFWVSQIPLAVLLYMLGGMTWIIWGIGVRTVFVYHITWLINSASHTFGYQTYNTGDRSTNVWWLALLTFGESWHNNHHKHQRSAAHGLKWWEIDMTYTIIRLLEFLGLAWAVRLPKEHEIL